MGYAESLLPAFRNSYSPKPTRLRFQLSISLAAILLLLLAKGAKWGPYLEDKPLKDVQSSLVVGTIKWWNCGGGENAELAECGYIVVPTDYKNSSAGVTTIALGRYNAAKSPRKGMVLFNPGGPGGPGKPFVTAQGPRLQALTGEDYDIVGFDPRGIGETRPAVRCFRRGIYQPFLANTVLERGFDVGGDLESPQLRQGLLKQQREANALYQTQFELCGQTMNDDYLRYMGTTLVARDIDFITTVLEGEDALINFYGGSYGSVIGQYLVNMFPNRVGRVVIDAIVDAVAWANEPNYKWYRSWLSSADDAYRSFFQECSKAGPPGCALAQEKHENSGTIRDRLEGFFHGLYNSPLPVPVTSTIPGIITEGRARMYLFKGLQRPRTWSRIAEVLDSAMRGNGTDMLDSAASMGHYQDLERSAVTCSDVLPMRPTDAPSTEEIVDELIRVLADVSPFAMSVTITEPDSGCQYWPVDPPERFTGPWNHTLRNPILIHSNSADPVTPISSGRLVKKLLGDSARLAIKDTPGHGSLSTLASLCTVAITRAYFATGALPENEHVCPVDESAFPASENSRTYTEEEQRILEAVWAIGDALQSLP